MSFLKGWRVPLRPHGHIGFAERRHLSAHAPKASANKKPAAAHASSSRSTAPTASGVYNRKELNSLRPYPTVTQTYELLFAPEKRLYIYHLDFLDCKTTLKSTEQSPKHREGWFREQLKALLPEDQDGQWVRDFGSGFYTTTPLPLDWTVHLKDDASYSQTEYDVKATLQYALDTDDILRTLNGNPASDVNVSLRLALSSILRHRFQGDRNLLLRMDFQGPHLRYVSAPDAFPAHELLPKEPGILDARRGHWISFYVNDARPAVRVRASTVPCAPAQPLVDVLRRYPNGEAEPYLRRLALAVTHRRTAPLKYCGLSEKTARQERMVWKQMNVEISVEEYFQHAWNITLEHADDMPLVDIGGGGTKQYMPAELCMIPFQQYPGKQGRVLAALADVPLEPVGEKDLAVLGLRPAHPLMEQFGLSIGDAMDHAKSDESAESAEDDQATED